MRADFLLEIGCEDIPAWMLPQARLSLKELLERELKPRGLLLDKPLETFATPRRLAACCAALAATEPDRVEELVGPAKNVAYDPSGKPTRAAGGFAQKLDLKLSQLKLVETPKGTYLAGVARRKGRPTPAVLAEVLPRVISQISFPRTMYWTSPQGQHFIRPIRWLVALWGGKPVEFEVGGVRSGRLSQGHRFLSNKPIAMHSAGDYQRRLRQAGVMVEAGERRARIEQESEGLLKAAGLHLRKDPGLLELVVNLVEHPTVVRGEFSREFLELPEEVLVTVMRHHQKYFSVEDRKGQLVPAFVAVIDLDGDKDGTIQRNHEAVLAARFHDAQFFWQADQKRTLADRRALLKDVVFESRLGSYAHKVGRLVGLARWLGETASAEGRRADIGALTRAAELSKCDLTTEMVREFPELQGVVGGLYARAQREAEAVAGAIAEHYRPAGPDDSVPRTLEGALLAVADKLETIAACFGVGLIPTGSRDPFALRRAGGGIVRIIVEHKLRLSLAEAIRQAFSILAGYGLAGRDASTQPVEQFLEERSRQFFREVRRFPYDEVNAAFAAGWDDLVDLEARLEALHRIRPTPDFEPLAVAFKRIGNILEQAGGPDRSASPIDNNLIEAGAERELYDRFRKLGPQVAEQRSKHYYEQALRLVASLRPQVDRFFDKVLVMAPDKARRENRLALLAHLLREFSTIADFSEIVVSSKLKE